MKTITENPLRANNFFITPKGNEHLLQILETMDKDGMKAAMLTWNLASKLVDEAIDKSEQDIDEKELKIYECEGCGSRNLNKGCHAVWDIDEQNWIIKKLLGGATCRDCGLFDEPVEVTL